MKMRRATKTEPVDMADFKIDAVGKIIYYAIRSREGWIPRGSLLTMARKYLGHYFPSVSRAIDGKEFNQTADTVLRAMENRWYIGRRGNSYMFLGE